MKNLCELHCDFLVIWPNLGYCILQKRLTSAAKKAIAKLPTRTVKKVS